MRAGLSWAHSLDRQLGGVGVGSSGEVDQVMYNNDYAACNELGWATLMTTFPFDVTEIYQREVVPHLREFNVQRKEYRLFATFFVLLIAIFGILLFAVVYYYDLSKLLFFKSAVPALVMFCAFPLIRFRRMRKQFFITKALRWFRYYNVEFAPRQKVCRRDLKKFRKWPWNFVIVSEDGLRGKQAGATFIFNEINISAPIFLSPTKEKRIFSGWLLRNYVARRSVAVLNVVIIIDATTGAPIVMPTDRNQAKVDRWINPDLSREICVLAKIAKSKNIIIFGNESEFSLLIETNVNLFESISDPEIPISFEAFAMLVEDIHSICLTIKRIIDEVSKGAPAMPLVAQL